MPPICPPPEVIRELACGRVSPARERELDRHLAVCPVCRSAHDAHFQPILAAVRDLSTSTSGGPRPGYESHDSIEELARSPSFTVVRPGPPPALLDVIGASASSVPTEPGTELGYLGKFRLLTILGEGGMGRVYRAEDTTLRREVALKVILLRGGHRAASAEQRDGLFSEAQAAAKLNDPNIVGVYEVGEIDDTPYLVMPLLAGETLAARLRKSQLPAYQLCRIAEQIARGLAAAHGAGLVHRDIKPANVWLEPTAGGIAVRLLDFGLARPLTEMPAGLAGTPAYMAPEQAARKAVDHRADLFALGAVLFEMATGKRLFPGEARTVKDLLEAVREFDPPSATKLLPTVPPRLAVLIAGLLRNAPARRAPGTARELADALAARAAELDPGRWRRRVARAIQVAVLVLGGGLVVLGGLQLKRHLFDAPVNLVRKEPQKPEEQPVPQPKGVIPPAITADQRLANLDHLLREHIPAAALTAAGDGDPARVAPEVVAALAHPGFVETVAIHPKGKLLASAGNDRTVRLWDLAQSPPKELAILRNHTDSVNRLAFTADGNRLISGSGAGAVIVWRLAGEGAESAVQRFDTGECVTAIGVSRTSNLVAIGTVGGNVRVFDIDTGAGGEVVRGNRSTGIGGLLFTNNDKKLIVGSNVFLRLIDLADNNKELWNLGEAKVWFMAVAPSPDGTRFLANGFGFTAGERPGSLLFPGFGDNRDLERQRALSIRSLTGDPITLKKLKHGGRVVRAMFTPDGQQVVALTDDTQLHLWNWAAELKLASVPLAHHNPEHFALGRAWCSTRTADTPSCHEPTARF